jgi:hypothetical protein
VKITYKVYDFVNWKVEQREREIDVEGGLASNALYQQLLKKAKKGGPDLTHEPTAKLLRSS